MTTAAPGPHGGLTVAQYGTLLALADYANDRTGDAFPRLDRLAGAAGAESSTVRAAIASLIDGGFITKVGENRAHVATYRVIDVVTAWRRQVDASGLADVLEALSAGGDRWDDDADTEATQVPPGAGEGAPVLHVVTTPTEAAAPVLPVPDELPVQDDPMDALRAAHAARVAAMMGA